MRLCRTYCMIVSLAVTGFMLLAGCNSGPKKEITVLLRMMTAQEKFFKEQIIPQFEKENNCKVSVLTFNNEWDIERLLKLESSKKDPTIFPG